MAAKTSRSSVAIIPAVKRLRAGTTVGFLRYCFTATPPAPRNATPSATIPAVMESVCAYQPPGYASSSLLLLRFKSGRAFARTHEHWKHMHSTRSPRTCEGQRSMHCSDAPAVVKKKKIR